MPLQIVCGHSREDGILGDYCDSMHFKTHPLFGADKTALQVLLYYDEVELCNPLGSNRTKHKIGTQES